MAELRLEAREFEDQARWRWVLTDASGTYLADHEVRLDTGCWQHEAFTDLLGYLYGPALLGRSAADEARIVGDLGEWIGSQVLGPVAGAMVRARPATVRVVVPAEARALLFRPLELAHVDGKPISAQDVTLVMQPGSDEHGAAGSGAGPGLAGERLRVLGLFSLPEGEDSLSLRRERYSLVQLIRGIAASGKAADVRVLQYGVTRRRLRDVLEEAEGWDVIHISGHGAPGELLLEDAAGRPDTVSATDLAQLLDLARERVSLVTVSACWSAAPTAAEPEADSGGNRRNRGSAGLAPPGFEPGAVATELADRLGCAVLAMRYPLNDYFAVAFAAELYKLLAAKGQPLPRAVGISLKQLMADGWSALAVATPALFGLRAVGLRLAAPPRTGPVVYDAAALKMAGFPPQPDRFEGRTGVMARASAALAAESRVPGVLLRGTRGEGETACALELAYTHEHAFDRLVWFKAPDESRDIRSALTDFALTLERELPGFLMAGLLADAQQLAAFLPRLTELAELRRVLIVVDSIESLLTEGGQWRDDRWGQVIGALGAHKGMGRLILTSRRLPATGVAGLRVLAVDAVPPE